jgi:CubicO group peptidase (beta-lactamase class C family)
MKNPLAIVILLFLLISCAQHNSGNGFIGFWEGPHPENPQWKFYIQLEKIDETYPAKGYWAENNFYQSSFNVEKVNINGDSISFQIPGWNCMYSGVLNNNSINGGFYCEGEPFDSVCLVKNNEIENHLIYPKPECKNPDFRYKRAIPAGSDDQPKTSNSLSTNDSLFIYALVPEIINGDYGRINSFLLFKNNKLICEEYFFGYSPTDLHPIESCTKSITSLLIGIAKDKNLIANLNEPVFKIFPEYLNLSNAPYNKITVKHLLTMTSGFDPQNDQLFQSENRIDYALKRKIINQPGSIFTYDGGNTEILGAILKKKTGLFADELAQKYLFEPLNIGHYNWEIHKQNGFPSMGGALHLMPRDMLKTGILVLNKGSFNNRQIISEQWIQESTSVKTKTHIPDDDYSYQWWNLHLSSSDKIYEAIWANGWGSQFIYVFPEIKVVMVTTGHNYEGDSWAITDGIRKYLHLLDDEKYHENEKVKLIH